ncbi:MAG: hypothetical protein ABIR60_01400, partial [Allosphingosinicella sp.]
TTCRSARGAPAPDGCARRLGPFSAGEPVRAARPQWAAEWTAERTAHWSPERPAYVDPAHGGRAGGPGTVLRPLT